MKSIAAFAFVAAITATSSAFAGTVAEENATFARELYAEIAKSQDDLFLGPTSVSTALAMAWGGARGKTASEIAKALHFTQPNEHEAQNALMAKLSSSSPDGPRVAIANRLYGQTGLAFDPAFVKLTTDRYGAPLQALDFAGAPEPSRKIIDAWVNEKTDGMIPELLQPGAIDETTRLVIVNAMAFHAAWATPFMKQFTKDEAFTTRSGATKKVPMMHGDITARLGETTDAQVLSMPYASKDPSRKWSMVIVLPKGKEADLQKAFDAKLTYGHVMVSMPKFKMRTHVELASTLRKMGIHDAFDAKKADFTGITTSKPIFVSNVIHEAFVDVDETGTRAAAATALVATEGEAVASKTFTANKSFTFAVRDDATGAILFLGRVSEPKL